MRDFRSGLGMLIGVSLLVTACGGTQPAAHEVMPTAIVEPTTPVKPTVTPQAPTLTAILALSPTPAILPTVAATPFLSTGKALVVDQSLQMLVVYEDGQEIRRIPASTGKPTYTTYTLAWTGYVGKYWGTFESRTGGYADDAWFLYQATGAILIHSLPYYVVDGEKQYYGGEFLGVAPDSDGCIRIHPDDARWLTEWNPLNAAVTVTEWPGEIEGLIGQ